MTRMISACASALKHALPTFMPTCPSRPTSICPWSFLGLDFRERLAASHHIGGPTAEVFAAKPDLIELFHSQVEPTAFHTHAPAGC